MDNDLYQITKTKKWTNLIIVDPLRLSYNDTDSEMLGEQSGMDLKTDYGTGCQYLETSLGYLTPRLDKDGKQVCGK